MMEPFFSLFIATTTLQRTSTNMDGGRRFTSAALHTESPSGKRLLVMSTISRI